MRELLITGRGRKHTIAEATARAQAGFMVFEENSIHWGGWGGGGAKMEGDWGGETHTNRKERYKVDK